MAAGEYSRALFLLVLANSLPWAAARVGGSRWSAPLDFGAVLWDGQRMFGSHKTWRGLIAATAACAAAAPAIGVSWVAGAGFGVVSLLGDALSSSVKRRLSLAPGTNVAFLDQLPEALLPLMVFAPILRLRIAEVIAVSLIFTAIDLLSSRLRAGGS